MWVIDSNPALERTKPEPPSTALVPLPPPLPGMPGGAAGQPGSRSPQLVQGHTVVSGGQARIRPMDYPETPLSGEDRGEAAGAVDMGVEVTEFGRGHHLT